ncbi:MFS transporter [Marinobacter fonticola]|uniref:MFS transporter n=1 Tax=Marinobacter fonticola TaxID=2603215 RepID=UPI0011E6EA25|nr:MFS transporter [Marinobacter fonticola]
MTAAFLAQSMLLVAIPVHALDLHASPLELGAIFSAPAILPLFFAIPMGGFVSHRGGRFSIISGAVVTVVGIGLILALPSIPGLFIAQLLIGLAQMQMVLAAQTVVSSLGTGKTLENYFGWYTTWLSGGQVIGPLLAGGLIDLYGTAEPAFYAMALLSLVGAFLALGLIGDAREGRATDRSVSGFLAQGRLLKTNRGVQVSIAVTMAAMFALTVHGSYLPVYLDGLGLGASTIGFLVSLRAIASMLVRPFTGRIISILGGRETTVLFSVVAMTVGLGFTGSVHAVVALGLLSVLVGIGAGLSQPLSMVLLAESVDSEQRSGALGMRLMGNRAVKLIAPLLFGAVFAMAGFGVAFMVGGVTVGVCGILLYWIVRRLGVESA